jgi:hypothetical protein
LCTFFSLRHLDYESTLGWLAALAVAAQVKGNDFEVILETFDIARLMPFLAAAASPMQQHQKKTLV